MRQSTMAVHGSFLQAFNHDPWLGQQPVSCQCTSWYPASYLLSLIGCPDRAAAKARCCWGQRLRHLLFCLFLAVTLAWFLVFTFSTYYQTIGQHAQQQAKGATDSSLIIRILDDISWVCIMLRNALILLLASRSAQIFHHLTFQLSKLSASLHAKRLSSAKNAGARYAMGHFVVSLMAVIMTSLLCLTYWNRPNYSQLYTSWPLDPFPISLQYWQVSLLMIFLCFLPFVLAQSILSSLVGLGHDAFILMKNVNHSLGEAAKDKSISRQILGRTDHLQDCDLSSESGSSSVAASSGTEEPRSECDVHQPMEQAVGQLRFQHFKICRLVEEISQSFSGILLTALMADLMSAVGFVGVIIGYKSSPRAQPMMVLFDRAYQGIAALLWMVFFLCAQYWPFVKLHEEAETTYHLVHKLSLVNGNRMHQREITHFLLATKDAHVGVIAGKLFLFSRNLCATMVSFLCSFGVILYELLHKDQSGGLASIIESATLGHQLNGTLNSSLLLALQHANTSSSSGRHGSMEL